MVENYKVGGVYFDIGVDTKSLDTAFDSIKREMENNADNIEEIYNSEMQAIIDAIEDAQNKMLAETNDGNKEIIGSYTKMLESLRGRVESHFENLNIGSTISKEIKEAIGNIKPEELNKYDLSKIKEAGANMPETGVIADISDFEDALTSLDDVESILSHMTKLLLDAEEASSKLSGSLEGVSEDSLKEMQTNAKKACDEFTQFAETVDSLVSSFGEQGIEEGFISEDSIQRIDEFTSKIDALYLKYSAISDSLTPKQEEDPKVKQSNRQKEVDADTEAHKQRMREIKEQTEEEKKRGVEAKNTADALMSAEKLITEQKKQGAEDSRKEAEISRKASIDELKDARLVTEAKKQATEKAREYAERTKALSVAALNAQKAQTEEDKRVANEVLKLKRLEVDQAKIEAEISRKAYTDAKRAISEQVEADRKRNAALASQQKISKQLSSDQARSIGTVTNSMDKLNAKVNMFITALAGRTMYDWLIGTPAQYQRTVNTFGLLINDIERAKESMRDLKELAFETPYNLVDLSSVANQLAGTDLYISTIEDLIPRLGALGRGDNEVLAQISKATTDIINAGKVQGEELRQLKNSGIPIIQEMSKVMGLTTSEFRDMVSDGRVGVDVYLKAVKSLTSEGGKYYGLLDSYSNDYLGRLEQIQGKFKELGMEIGEKALKNLTEYFGKLLEKMENGELDSVVEEWSDILNDLTTTVTEVMDFIANNPGLVSGAVKVTAFTAALGLLGNTVKGILVLAGPVGITMKALGAEMVTLSGTTVTLTGATGALGAAATLTVPQIAALSAGMVLAYNVGKEFGEMLAQNVFHMYSFNEALEDGEAGAKLTDDFNKANEALKEFGININKLSDSTNAKFESLSDDLERLYELNSLKYLTDEQNQELVDLVNKLNKVLPIMDRLQWEDGKILNLDSLIKSFKETDVILDDKIKQAVEFKNKYNEQLSQLGKLGDKKLEFSDLQNVLGKDVSRAYFEFMKDEFSKLKDANGKEIEMTAKNFVDYYSRILEVPEAISKSVIGETEEAVKGFEKLNESLEESREKVDAVLARLNSAKYADINFVATLDDSDIQDRLKFLDEFMSEKNAKPMTLVDTEAIDKLLKSDPTKVEEAWKNLGASVVTAVDNIETKIAAGEIGIATLNKSQEDYTKSIRQAYQDYLIYLVDSGQANNKNLKLAADSFKGQLDSVNEYFNKVRETLNGQVTTVMFKAQYEGFLSPEEAGKKTQVYSDALKTQQVKAKEEQDKWQKEYATEDKRTNEQRAKDELALLKRKLDVQLLTISQFNEQAKAIRERYLKGEVLQYKEYSKELQNTIDAHNKEVEQKRKESLEKQKVALEASLKQSDKYFAESVYKGYGSDKDFITAYTRYKALVDKAFKQGVIDKVEYEDELSRIGDAAYESRYTQSEKYLDKQEKLGTATFEQQMADWDKIAKYTQDAYKRGLIDFVEFNEKMEEINNKQYDIKYKQIEKLMNAHMKAVKTKYDAEVKEINDAYDKLDREKEDKKRTDRMKELLSLEAKYANAVTKEGKDRLKEIREEMEQINEEVEKQKLQDERQNALDKLSTQFSDFESAFDSTMDKIGTSALDTSKSVQSAVDSMVKNFGKLGEFNWVNPYVNNNSGLPSGGVSITNNNTVNVKTTSQAVAVGNQINGFTAAKQMSKGIKK